MNVSMLGDVAVIGAPGRMFGLPRKKRRGAAHVFVRKLGTWHPWTRFENPTPTEIEFFGYDVSLDANNAFVGVGLDNLAGFSAGSVYVYDLFGTGTTTYCTSKTNSKGCAPSIGTIGLASFSESTPFRITATNVINQKQGFLLYGTAGRAAVPFQGGTLCLASPILRVFAGDSGGNPLPEDCSGSFAYDFNAWMQSNWDPALMPGLTVDAQYWYRDNASPSGTGLTDAAEFTPCP